MRLVLIVFLVLWACLGEPEQPTSRWENFWCCVWLLLALFGVGKEES